MSSPTGNESKGVGCLIPIELVTNPTILGTTARDTLVFAAAVTPGVEEREELAIAKMSTRQGTRLLREIENGRLEPRLFGKSWEPT